VSFVNELGWELHIPAANDAAVASAGGVYETLLKAGAHPVVMAAVASCATESFNGHVGGEFKPVGAQVFFLLLLFVSALLCVRKSHICASLFYSNLL
jgi:glycine cleavage system aminomethyltransferase T